MIIGFIGKKQSGKDTCANYICKNYSFVKYSFAYPLKEACKLIFGWTDDHVHGTLKEKVDPRWNVSPREAMQIVGTELFQYDFGKYLPAFQEKIGRHIWVKKFEYFYENYKRDNNKELNVCISDVRFLHEVQKIKEMNGIIVKVTRYTKNNLYHQHPSEKEMDSLNYDFILENNFSFNRLYSRLDSILELRKYLK